MDGGTSGGSYGGMEIESGLEPDLRPNLDEFVLARIAEDKRVATDAVAATGREQWSRDAAPVAGTVDGTPEKGRPEKGRPGNGGVHGEPENGAVEHVVRHDPARVLAECAAKRRIAQACRDTRPDVGFLGVRPRGMADFPLPPSDLHQFAAVTLALLALPYADHHDYRPEWRP